MGTTIRAEISKNSKYWISKHRYYELKHFCLQYPEWEMKCRELDELFLTSTSLIKITKDQVKHKNVIADRVIEKAYFLGKMDLVKRIAIKADNEIYTYILKAVTEGLSYSNLKTKLDIPCGKDMYYDRYRKFFWLLDKERG